MTQYEKFRQLHFQQQPLLLGNVWNPASAQWLESAGFQAIGTSSGAVASSLGYMDGEKIPFEELLYLVRRIKASTSIPLSVDMERGYTDDLAALTDYIQTLIDAGIAGINLEDAQGEDIYLRKLESIRNHLGKTNQQLFINARTDAYLQKMPAALEVVIRRAQRYQDAGADGLFVTAVPGAEAFREITATTSLPVNIVASPRLPVEVLSKSGVKRISMAVTLFRMTYNQLEKTARQVISNQSFSPLF